MTAKGRMPAEAGNAPNGRGKSGSSALRALGVALLVVVCAAGVAVFQITRPENARGGAAAFVPSPRFFREFSPGFRTAIADAYWLAAVQYYGKHLKSDRRFPALPAYLRLVTDLSPHFTRAYMFGAFALLDAGEGQQAYQLLKKGARRNPDDWQIPATAGMLVYMYGKGAHKNQIAAGWYEQAAAIPGRPEYVPRVAAELLKKGGDREKAITMWAQVYVTGDRYSRDKALQALDRILPEGRKERLEALRQLPVFLTPGEFAELVQALVPQP